MKTKRNDGMTQAFKTIYGMDPDQKRRKLTDDPMYGIHHDKAGFEHIFGRDEGRDLALKEIVGKLNQAKKSKDPIYDIEVTGCKDCPLCKYMEEMKISDPSPGYGCNYARKIIGATKKTPKWCPLREANMILSLRK